MPIATLSTDIGTNDYLSGAIKGQLLTANSTLNIVDITHHYHHPIINRQLISVAMLINIFRLNFTYSYC